MIIITYQKCTFSMTLHYLWPSLNSLTHKVSRFSKKWQSWLLLISEKWFSLITINAKFSTAHNPHAHIKPAHNSAVPSLSSTRHHSGSSCHIQPTAWMNKSAIMFSDQTWLYLLAKKMSRVPAFWPHWLSPHTEVLYLCNMQISDMK